MIGGRWKPLHHMMQQSAYADVTASCGRASVTMMDAEDEATGPALCYVRNFSITLDAGWGWLTRRCRRSHPPLGFSVWCLLVAHTQA